MDSSKIEDLKQWINELIYPGIFKDFVHVTTDILGLFKASIYTDEHIYQISAVQGKNDYLGCQVTARKERPGESWKRGNDLSDGPLIKDTWNRIINDIVKYELVKLSEYRKPNNIPE
jgi:hypothetical protein